MTLSTITPQPDQVSIISPSDQSPIIQPWEQQPGEPQTWYDRFTFYYLPQGINRSIVAAYKMYRVDKATTRGEVLDSDAIDKASGSWNVNSQLYNWIERAKAHDAYTREQWLEQVNDMAIESHRQRVNVFQIALDKLTQAWRAKVVDEDVSVNSLSNAIKTVARELRTDLPLHSQRSGDIEIVIRNLPQNLRLAILAAVDSSE